MEGEIRNLLKCNLTDDECWPVYLEEENLAEGIVECGSSVYAKVLSLKDGFILANYWWGSSENKKKIQYQGTLARIYMAWYFRHGTT
ncbi:hypothetical protein LIER_24557 [Lithospermum erythrorhizon]|uniref:Uncharacterized protein n=1 Tax=Lithospermum erythrorhizon TaxID=34254 RepID=A0AAV3R4V0_LITER